MARALGVQCREIRQVIMGLPSAELDPSKTIETPHVSHYCCKAQQHGNNNRFNFCSVLQLRALLCVCGPLLHMCGHDVCVYALCVCAPCTAYSHGTTAIAKQIYMDHIYACVDIAYIHRIYVRMCDVCAIR